MTFNWWPRKPEPVLNWRLVKFVSFCVDCDAEVITRVPMLVVLCLRCAEGRQWVDSLPYSVQDHYLAYASTECHSDEEER